MKKSDKIEKEALWRKERLGSTGEPTLWDIWKGVCQNKALLKHVIDNDLRHIWRIILVILSYLVAGTIGFLLKSLGII
jgi:hypothetical protein